MARVLVTGMSGSVAQLVSERLLDDGHEVIGVDYRARRPGTRRAIVTYRANYNKRLIEEIFRKHRPSHVLHLGRVGNLKTDPQKRFDLNVVGSAKIMDLALEHAVERLVVLSTFHIYGAHPANHIPIHEDEPLRASQSVPQLADAVQLDAQACTWVYRHRKLGTVVLRPCNVVGPNVQNAVSSYLRQPTIPYLLGYSPMWQFVHEIDLVEALTRALFGSAVGIFNLAGAGELPLLAALRKTGARLLPLPGPLAALALRLGATGDTPPYLVDFLRYPCVITDARFREAFGYRPTIGIGETIESAVKGVF